MSERLTRYGICRHADGVLIELVPGHIGYTLDEVLAEIRVLGAVTWTREAQRLAGLWL